MEKRRQPPKKKKRVLIMGLYNYENLGDQLLGSCVKYLVDRCGYEGVAVGFQPERNGKRFETYRRLRRLVSAYVPGSFKDFFYYRIMKWFVKPHYEECIKESDGLIFGCGSYKYSTQNLWMTYSLAVDIARKYGKPVMFHGMNIETFRKNDWRCCHLKKRTNYNVVKMITTRDGDAGVARLRKDYIVNPDTEVFGVGDFAFWLKECFPPHTTGERTDVVGVNLIRKGIIKDYGGNVTPDELLLVYVDLLKKLDEQNIEWELFTNGEEPDYTFGLEILHTIGREDKNIAVSGTAKGLIDLISGYKAVFGAKLHACIISYVTDTPFVGLCWEEKFWHFADTNNLMERFCDSRELSGDRLFQIFTDTVDKPFDLKRREMWKRKNLEAIQLFLEKYVG